MDAMDEVGDVECPEEGGEPTVFGDAFVHLNVGIIIGEDVKDTVHEGGPEDAKALPKVRGDVILMQTDEELVSGDSWESQFNISE